VPAAVSIGVIAALVYAILFNRKSWQGWHDLVCRTYVVEPRGWPLANSFPQTALWHRSVATWLLALGVAVALVPSLARYWKGSVVSSGPPDSALSMADLDKVLAGPAVRAALGSDRTGGLTLMVCAETRISFKGDAPGFYYYETSREDARPGGLTLQLKVMVEDRFDHNRSSSGVKTLQLTASRFGSPRPLADRSAVWYLAASLIDTVAEIDSFQALRVEVESVHDIWIASRTSGVAKEASPAEWRQLLSQ
jgi:hypothetical protein